MFKRLFGMSTIIALCYGVDLCQQLFTFRYSFKVYTADCNKLRIITFTYDAMISRNSAVRWILTTKLSYRNIMIISAVIMLIGLFLLSTLTPETSRALLTVYMIIIGFGVGFSFSVLSMASIHNFGMEQHLQLQRVTSFVH